MGFKTGDHIIHASMPDWGVGVILVDEYDGKIRVDFKWAGEKTLLVTGAIKSYKKGKKKDVLTSPFCIYTIKHSGDLERAFNNGGAGKFTEGTNWRSGIELLNDGKEMNMTVPVIFSAAEATRKLLYWGILTDVRIENISEHKYTTTYMFKNLTAIKGRKSKTDLVLRSTGKKVDDNFIKPYAICRTPEFIKL